jgi:hypothetical protein
MSVTSVCTEISLNAALCTVYVHVDFRRRELMYSLETEGAAIDPCNPCLFKSTAYWRGAPHGVI